MSVLSNGYLLALTAAGGVAEVDVEWLLVGGGSHAVGSSSYNSASGGGGGGGVLTNVSGQTGTRGIAALPSLTAQTDSVTYAVIIGASSSLSSFAGTNYSGGGSSSFTYKSNGGSSEALSTSGGHKYNRGGHSGSVDVNGTVTSGYNGTNRGGAAFSECYQQQYTSDPDCSNTYYGAGAGATQDASGQDGGDGASSTITGSTIYVAGGGAGSRGANTNYGTDGQGQNGYGGGGRNDSSGADDVLILKYSSDVTVTNPGGGLTFSTTVSGSNHITTITAGSGNITFSN